MKKTMKQIVLVAIILLSLSSVLSLLDLAPFKISPAYASTTVTYQVGDNVSDCQRRLHPDYWSTTAIEITVGDYDNVTNYEYGVGMVFTNVAVPAGAQITNAYLTVTCRITDAVTTMKSLIHGELSGNPAAFTTSANFDGRTRTGNLTTWDNAPAWTKDQQYTSTNISVIVREIIEQGTWASGNNMSVFWDDFAGRSGNAQIKSAYPYDTNSTGAPKLTITYSGAPPTIDSCTTSYSEWECMRTSFAVTVKVSDTDGWANLNYVELRFEFPADTYTNIILRWTQGTGAFSTIAGSSYIFQTGSSKTNTVNQVTLNFRFLVDWNYPLTTDVDVQVYAVDDEANSVGPTKFDLNEAIINTVTTTPVSSDYRQNVGGTVQIMGNITYTGTQPFIIPDSQVVQVQVHNSTDAIMGTGVTGNNYSITTTLPSAVGDDTYHIYVNGVGNFTDGDIGVATSSIIADSLMIFNVQPVQYQGSGAFYYQAQIEWVWDSVLINGATCGVAYPNDTAIGSMVSNSTGWLSFIINQGNATSGDFIIYGINDNNYSITVSGSNKTFTLYDWALNTKDIDGGAVSNTNLVITKGATSIWSGTQRTLYIPADTFAVSITWLQSLPVNTTASVVVAGATSTDFNCTVYPLTGTAYHYASNQTITTTSYSSYLLSVEFSGATSTYVLVVDKPAKPTFILNATYDYVTHYTPYTYLVLPHYGNATLTVSYESFGGLYVQKTTHKFLTVTFGSKILSITATGTSGDIGTIEVYCGTWGNPVSTTGWIATSYSSTLSVFTGTFTFASDKTVTLTWMTSGGGPTGGGPGEPAIQPLMATVVLSFPARNTLGTTINAFINITWTGVSTVTVQEIFIDLAPFNSWQLLVPDGLPQQLVLSGTMGTATIPITLTIPEDVEPGTYVVPCIVSFGWESGAGTKTFRTVSTLEIVLPPPTVPDLMTYFWVGMFAVLAVGMLVFRQRRKH